MKIDKHIITAPRKIKELTAGDTFIFNFDLYILTNEHREVSEGELHYEAVRLLDGYLAGFGENILVSVVPTKVIHEDYPCAPLAGFNEIK